MSEIQIDNNIFANPEAFRAQLTKIDNKEIEETLKPEEQEVKNDTIPEENTAVQTQPEEAKEQSIDEPEKADEQPIENAEQSAKESKYIPKSRFNQELAKRKELEDALIKEREEKIRFQTQLEMFQKLQNIPQQQVLPQQAPKLPELNQLDALDKESHQVYTKAITEAQKKADEAIKLSQQLQYTTFVNAQIQAFEKQHPDYMLAVEFVKKAEKTVLNNITNDEKAINEGILNKLGSIGMAAINNGKNAAEAIYNMARAYGYIAPDNNQEQQKTTERGPNLNAINQNAKKTASIQNIGNNIGMAASKVVDITKAFNDPKGNSGIDPAKFREILKRAETN